jgi:hypothetical protein
MGKENPQSPILFIGTVGDIISYVVKGKTYYRRKPTKKYFAHSEKQLLQRTQFLSCQKFAQKVMDDINKEIWNKCSDDMHGFDLFKKTNYHEFDTNGNIANFKNLKLSKGNLLLPETIRFENNEAGNGAITIIWENEDYTKENMPSDWLRIIAICEGEPIIVQGIIAFRHENTATFQLPWENGKTVHLYAYFVNEANNCGSNSFYQMLQV